MDRLELPACNKSITQSCSDHEVRAPAHHHSPSPPPPLTAGHSTLGSRCGWLLASWLTTTSLNICENLQWLKLTTVSYWICSRLFYKSGLNQTRWQETHRLFSRWSEIQKETQNSPILCSLTRFTPTTWKQPKSSLICWFLLDFFTELTVQVWLKI